MPIFTLFVSACILFGSAFSLWVTLNNFESFWSSKSIDFQLWIRVLVLQRSVWTLAKNLWSRFFAKTGNGFYSLTILVKKLHHRCLTGSLMYLSTGFVNFAYRRILWAAKNIECYLKSYLTLISKLKQTFHTIKEVV